jgi:hypothetical protein
MTRTTPRRLMILHFGQRFFTDGETFIATTPSLSVPIHIRPAVTLTAKSPARAQTATQSVIIPHSVVGPQTR